MGYLSSVERKHERQIKSAVNGVVHDIRYMPFAIRQAVVQRNYDAAMDGLAKAIQAGEPWAITTYFKIAETLGPDTMVIFQQRLGVGSEQEALGLIESGRMLEGMADMTIEAQLDAALQVVRMCVAKEPEHRKTVVKLLESYAEVEG